MQLNVFEKGLCIKKIISSFHTFLLEKTTYWYDFFLLYTIHQFKALLQYFIKYPGHCEIQKVTKIKGRKWKTNKFGMVTEENGKSLMCVYTSFHFFLFNAKISPKRKSHFNNSLILRLFAFFFCCSMASVP